MFAPIEVNEKRQLYCLMFFINLLDRPPIKSCKRCERLGPRKELQNLHFAGLAAFVVANSRTSATCVLADSFRMPKNSATTGTLMSRWAITRSFRIRDWQQRIDM
jgi:hypothetical protein